KDFQQLFNDWIMLAAAASLLGWVLVKGGRSAHATPSVPLEVRPYRNWRAAAVICAACGVLGVGPLLVTRAAGAAPQRSEGGSLPALAACGSPVPWSPRWPLAFEVPNVVVSGTYGCVEPISVFVAAYRENVQRRELTNVTGVMIPSESRNYSTTGRESFKNAA